MKVNLSLDILQLIFEDQIGCFDIPVTAAAHEVGINQDRGYSLVCFLLPEHLKHFNFAVFIRNEINFL